jgi:ACS family hexuronate transporter-like MFS transporter
MAGSIGGMLVATGTGWMLQLTGSYLTPFLVAGSAYLVALLIIQVLVPRVQPVEV